MKSDILASLSPIRQRIYRVQHCKDFVEETTTLEELYALLNQLSADVFAMYPHIDCQTGCNRCCKGLSMPTVTATEWARVHHFVSNNYTDTQRQNLLKRIRTYYNPYKEVYWQLHDTLQTPPTTQQLNQLKTVLPQLSQNQCPFLENEKCSVYNARPAKCRAQGAFLIQLGEHAQLQSCNEEVDKMDVYLKQQGSRRVTLPLWNHVEKKLKNDYNPADTVSTVLPIWLATHIHKGELIAKVNLTPDFDTFRGCDI